MPTPLVSRAAALAVLLALANGACKRAPSGEQPSDSSGPGSRGNFADAKTGAPSFEKSAPKSQPVPEIWKQFSGGRAFEEVRQQVEIGPRPSGSPEVEKARKLIEESLRAARWQIERQTFTAETPRGPIEFANVIARFSGTASQAASTKAQRAIVCSHYDTKRFSTIRFVGASDGASSTGALLELARVLALDPDLAQKIELVFFDGEEALVQFTAPDDPKPDGLFGSRHYASELRRTGRAAQFKFAILWDMIGDKNLNITLSPDSPPDLTRELLTAAETLGLRDSFGYYDRSILDDHVMLAKIARIPALDLIDFDYPPWHTADDTLDRISPESLQKIGAVTLYHLRRALAK